METSKIVISMKADRDLEEMVAVVNDGFSSGRVKKGQLASWIVSFFKAAYFAKHVQTIRGDHFDEVAHLNSVIKQIRAAKKSDQAVEMDRLLSPLKESGKKSPRQAAMTRTLTFVVALLPTEWTSPSCKKRKSFTWSSGLCLKSWANTACLLRTQ